MNFLPRALLLTATILWLSVTAMAQGNRVFDIVVVSVSSDYVTIVGDTPNTDPKCKLKCTSTAWDIPLANWSKFTEWHWAPTNDSGKLPDKQPLPEVGQLLKGTWKDGGFHAIESCEVRAYRIAINKTGDPPDYARPSLQQQPLDCMADKTPFIQKLLASLNRHL